LAMTKFSLPGLTDAEQDKKNLLLAREILEFGALLSIRLKDLAAFERYVAQVKTYYYDFGQKIPVSSRQNMILGLNLMHLLAKNKLDEFHIELELIPLAQHQDQFIKHPVQLEQYMMEGAYNKVLKSKDSAPNDSYTFFMDLLMNTVRNEIADCLEAAYNDINVTDAQKLLGFSDANHFDKYAKERENAKKDSFKWQIGPNSKGVQEIKFQKEDQKQS